MTGQDAVNVSQNFNDKLGIDGVILTKLDGDTRGWCCPIYPCCNRQTYPYAGMGERLSI